MEQQSDLRAKSAGVVTAEDIEAVDDLLIEFVQEKRDSSHIIIDSHPVTKESYGFRATAFSQDRIRQLSLDEIWVLYTAPEVAIKRIAKDAQGRPQITFVEAQFHTLLQSSVAATYGILAGCPVYFFDTDCVQSEIVERLAGRLK
jgi:adenylate kinase